MISGKEIMHIAAGLDFGNTRRHYHQPNQRHNDDWPAKRAREPSQSPPAKTSVGLLRSRFLLPIAIFDDDQKRRQPQQR